MTVAWIQASHALCRRADGSYAGRGVFDARRLARHGVQDDGGLDGHDHCACLGLCTIPLTADAVLFLLA